MKKIVLNNCFGGFSLSPLAVKEYAKLAGFEFYPFVNNRDGSGKLDFNKYVQITWDELINNPEKYFTPHYSKKPLKNSKYDNNSYFSDRDIARNDINLVKVVEKLGKKANSSCAYLRVVEIPDDMEYSIEEYDGLEHVAEKHKTWD